jgi:hypothetical protein
MTRELTFSADADQYLSNLEGMMLLQGFSLEDIETTSAALVQVLFRKLGTATLTNKPEYEGLDSERAGYSLYRFDEGSIHGVYSSSGPHAHVLYVRVHFDEQAALSERVA